MTFFEVFACLWMIVCLVWLYRIETVFHSIHQWIMHVNEKLNGDKRGNRAA